MIGCLLAKRRHSFAVFCASTSRALFLMAACDAAQVRQYEFTELGNITEGRHNVIAVVKYFKPPKKTRGSGFSMFVTISDPSLKGEKFPVCIINNNIEKFPPVGCD